MWTREDPGIRGFAGLLPRLRFMPVYSNMLYRMSKALPKQRVTFRLESDLAATLRLVPNQTAFVEGLLRQALDQLCPLCHGSGQASGVHLSVSDLKQGLKGLPGGRLDRPAAAQLRALVRLGRQLLATDLALAPGLRDAQLEFRLERQDQLLLQGIIPWGDRQIELH